MNTRPRGRPTKLNPEIVEKIVDLIKTRGAFRCDAAALVGISEASFSTWFSAGSRVDARPEHRDFYLRVLKAEAEFKDGLVANIVNAAAHNPKIGLSLLSRRFPAQFGRKDNIEDKSAEDKAADAALVRDTVIERIEKMAEAMLAASAAAPAAKPEGDA